MKWRLGDTNPGDRILPDPVLGISVLNKRLDGFVALVYGAVLSYAAVVFVQVFAGCVHGARDVICHIAGGFDAFVGPQVPLDRALVARLANASACAVLYALTMAYLAADFAGMIKTTALFPYYSPSRYHLDLVIPFVFLLLFDAAKSGSFLFVLEFAALLLVSSLWGHRLKEDIEAIDAESLPMDHLRPDIRIALGVDNPEIRKDFHEAGISTGRAIAITHFTGASNFIGLWAVLVAGFYLWGNYVRPLLIGHTFFGIALLPGSAPPLGFRQQIMHAICGSMSTLQVVIVIAALMAWYVSFIGHMVKYVGRPNELFLPIFVPRSLKRLAAVLGKR